MKQPSRLRLTPTVVNGLLWASALGLLGIVVYLPKLQTATLLKSVDDYRSALPRPDPMILGTLDKGQIDSENAIRTSLIQGIGGTVLLAGLYFTYQNLRATQRSISIAEDKQVTERFSTAVGMLGSSSMHTRLGGIYALERIAKDSAGDYLQVMEDLTAFVREESPWPPKVKDSAINDTTGPVKLPDSAECEQSEALLTKTPALSTDVQAVITVLGRLKPSYQEGDTRRVDLSETDLRRLKAKKANFKGFDLRGAHLEGADLREAHFEGANLNYAYLRGATLWEAHLEGAQMKNAHLERANFWKAHLERTKLNCAHLEGADLGEARFEGATLWGAYLGEIRRNDVLGLSQGQIEQARNKDGRIIGPRRHGGPPDVSQ